MKEIRLKAYSDGACSNNDNWIGGYAYTLYYEDTTDPRNYLRSGGECEFDTTNNIMEMKAFLGALQAFVEYTKDKDSQNKYTLTLYTDSAYIYNCLTQKWYVKWKQNGWVNSKKEPVKNRELWEKILKYILNYDNITYVKVKGHSTDKFNNYVDNLAVKNKMLGKEVNYGE